MNKAYERLVTKIMKSAQGQSCIRCKVRDDTICGRHYCGFRQHAYGKGTGHKVHPFLVADFCNRCDREFIEGAIPKMDHELQTVRSEEFLHWCAMSLIRRNENGVIG